MPRIESQRAMSLVVVAVLGLLALSGRWLAVGRAALRDAGDRTRIFVTTGGDDGPGSLREAIFTADRADRAATIVMRVPRVVIETELPPLVNPRGVIIDASASGTEIDARGFTGTTLLEVRSPDSVVDGLRIRGASATALLVRAGRVQLRRLTIADSVEGIVLAAGASDVLIEESRFEANGTGISLSEPLPGVVVRNNQFARNEQAGIRAVSARPSDAGRAAALDVRSNRFEDDRISLVLIHIGARVEQNEFVRAREAAMFLMGRGAVVRANRARGGAGLGIFADETEDALIEDNELDHNAAVAVLVRSGGGTVTQNNRVYENGYGIAVVFGDTARPHVVRNNLLVGQAQDALYVVGASPLIAGNRALRSQAAAVRILEFVPLTGPRLPSRPHLADNVFTNNTLDAPVHGLYRVPPVELGIEP